MKPPMLKVFLVEDDEDDYILTRELLAETQKDNFELDWVTTAEAGLNAMLKRQHDVFLVDYRLGKDNGLHLLRDAVVRGCTAPIILLTGLGDKEVDSEAMKSGAADYLVKGQFDARLLERSIRHSIVRKRTENDLHQQLTRIRLLNDIAHAISERQDLSSILNVVLGQLEAHLPIDAGSVYLFEPQTATLKLAASSARNQSGAGAIAVRKGDRMALQVAGLSACSAGESLYVPDTTESSAAMIRALTGQGLNSAVAVPLMVEKSLFGILITAREKTDGFSAGEQKFLRALSEHVALAAHQAQLHTELQRAYDELRQTQQAVMQHERLRALGQLASGIAHDINNTLSPISGYAELLLRHERDLSDRAKKYLQHIKTASDDVAHIVTRMRDFYRKREENQPLLPVDVNQLVQQVIDLTRPRWRDVSQQRGVSVDIDLALDPRLPAVIGTESELREALTNLIFNAVDAMPQGGLITLRTRAGAWGAARTGRGVSTHVVLEVTDTGMGMDEETRKRCLEPFFSTKGQRGTGLGLAMVYGVVQRHEGSIEIESVPGKGTTFRLILPVRELSRHEVVDGGGAAPAMAPLRVLFVDDEPLLRELLKEVLETDGHDVSVADGGQVALDIFRAAQREGRPFDAVITDLGMPHLDGRRLAQILKSESPATPVIMMTGWGTLMREDGDKPANVDGMLNKPPKIRELQETLRQLAPKRTGRTVAKSEKPGG
jgi:signal transduction histidine kinase/DNA-binding response OmpR family regulator